MESVIGQVMIDEDGNETHLVHYAYLTGRVLFVKNRRVPHHTVACRPEARLLSGWHMSDEVRAVNCKMCKKTVAYKTAEEGLRVAEEKLKPKPIEADPEVAGVQNKRAAEEKLKPKPIEADPEVAGVQNKRRR